ncbi:MAG: tetraacyldisaccharide 4'-kinase [Candidatus Omnitrophica bacterium CG1_02_44_16]|nr:MAG: tetraacyldisaccharide 4'-kinase [Candidatus Omnitrophica bacterium CG1_02_44_16]PIY82571.1 MAG: tetraacyldisaccharide 4'-kinase [Candidatus Omnitrophica bacterium CG_4_10_14_0_8_um_filter_44_12]
MNGLKIFYTQNKITAAYIVLWPLLSILSCVFNFLLFARAFFYRIGIFHSYRPGLKVISIGNITLGGTGKTPFAAYLAKRLRSEGHRVAILLRGYKRPLQSDGMGSDEYNAVGDEASMLKSACGEGIEVLADKDRVSLAQQLQRQKIVDTVILDDGFQHFRLKRDLDIVTIDASSPFGNKLILPLGHLREPLSSLKRADCFCLTRCDEASEYMIGELRDFLNRLNPEALVLKAFYCPVSLYDLKKNIKEPVSFLKGKNVCLMAGIADPFSFLKTVRDLGAGISLKIFFDDHHHYSPGQIRDVALRCGNAKIKTVVTTEKDAARLSGFILGAGDLGVDFFVLKIALKIVEGEEALSGRLHILYNT